MNKKDLTMKLQVFQANSILNKSLVKTEIQGI